MLDFKKNRNMSTNSTNGSNPPPISINIGPNMGYVSSPQMVNSPTLPPSNILAPNAKPIYADSGRK